MILDKVGLRNTEMIPSDMPINKAATIVPRTDPSPPIITTIKLSRSGSPPIR